MRNIFLVLLFFASFTKANESWFEAAEKGDDKTIIAMLDKKAVNIDIQNANKDTALLLAIKSLGVHKNQKIIAELILRGANVRLSDQHGIQPIHLAMAKGADAIIEMLKEYGADMLAVTGPTFERNGDQNIGHSNLLHYASRLPNARWVCTLLEDYPNLLEQKDALGRTPLHVAARRGNYNALKAMIDEASRLGVAKQVIDVVDAQGFTALSRAVHLSHLPCAQVLLEAKANGNLPMGKVLLDPIKKNIEIDDEGINIELNLQEKASQIQMTIKQYADLRAQIADNFKTKMPMSPHRVRQVCARINKAHALVSLFGPYTRKRARTVETFAAVKR